jgi:hypothetical protein
LILRHERDFENGFYGGLHDVSGAKFQTFHRARLEGARLCANREPQVLAHGHQHSQAALKLSNRLPFSQRSAREAASEKFCPALSATQRLGQVAPGE